MTNQIQGEILFAAASGIYTPWMPVRGDRATFGVEVLQASGGTLKWSVETRTLDDPVVGGDPVALTTYVGSGAQLVLSSAASVDLCQELVRYKFEVTGTAGADKFVVFRALQPAWQNDR